MKLRGAPVLDIDGRPVGRRDPIELGPTQDYRAYLVDLTVERRAATPEDLARLDDPAPRPAPPVIPAAVHQLGADAIGPMPAASGNPAEPAEAPVATAPTVEEVDTVTVTATIEPEQAELPPLPCLSCAHVVVCRLAPEVAEAMYGVAKLRAGGDPAIRIRATVECDHFTAAPTALLVDLRPPAAAPREAARHPSSATEAADKAQRAADCLAALERHNGDRRAAAAELGIKGNAFAMIVKHAAREAVTA